MHASFFASTWRRECAAPSANSERSSGREETRDASERGARSRAPRAVARGAASAPSADAAGLEGRREGGARAPRRRRIPGEVGPVGAGGEAISRARQALPADRGG